MLSARRRSSRRADASSGDSRPRRPPPAWAALSDDQQLDELLYEKRYSLLFEGGHRWIDMRRYGRLDQLPLDLPTHRVFSQFPFPTFECDARLADPPATGC